MTFHVEVLKRTEAALYERFFESCPHGLIQQSTHWADAISPLSPDVPYFLVVKDSLTEEVLGGLPLYHFSGEFGGVLTSVPHAGPLGGILCTAGIPEESKKQVYEALAKHAIQLARQLQCIALTVITNPFSNDALLYHQVGKPDYLFNNYCQALYFPHRFDQAGSYVRGKSSHNNDLRRNLRKAERNNIRVMWSSAPDDFEQWYAIHAKRHSELGATPLPKQLLKNILIVLAHAGKANLAVVRHGENIIGGCIYVWHRNIADVFILSSDSEYMSSGINYAVTDFSLRHFHDRAIQWYNWQSSKRSGGVYAFKRRWGSVELPYQFLTWTFQGFERMFTVGEDRVAAAYQWHYVAPFEAIRESRSEGIFDKP